MIKQFKTQEKQNLQLKKSGMKNQLIDTKNDLAESIREQMVSLLGTNLASAVDLAAQAKHAHWNVRGPGFLSVHELFDKVYEMADEHADELAGSGLIEWIGLRLSPARGAAGPAVGCGPGSAGRGQCRR